MTFKSFINWFQNDDGSGKKPAESKIDWTEKRRDNRLDLDVSRSLTVHLKEEGTTSLVAAVQNVSVRGCGLIFSTPEERNRLSLKKILMASVEVDDFPIPLQVEVVRLFGDREAAIRFKPPFPRELEKLEKFLEPRCLGRSLREIEQAKLQQAQQKGMRWFQGVNETNLFSWVDSDGKSIVQQQLIFLDRVVEWKKDSAIQTGLIRPDEKASQGDVGWVKSELLDFDAITDPAVVHQARTLIESAQIDDAVKKIFLQKLSKAEN